MNVINRVIIKQILKVSLLVGILDLLAAFLNTYLNTGKGPEVVLRFIASGLLGKDAFEFRNIALFVGIIIHFVIALFWTSIFFVFMPLLKISAKHKIFVGCIYGIIIWGMMNFVFLPLSNVITNNMVFFKAIIGILILIINVGLPISILFYKTISSE